MPTRSAKSGRYVTAKKAKRKPTTTVKEKKPEGEVYWAGRLVSQYDSSIVAYQICKDEEHCKMLFGDGVTRVRITRVRIIEIGLPKRRKK